ALAATSGTPRPFAPSARAGTFAFTCHSGSRKEQLTPPPVAKSRSFQPTSVAAVSSDGSDVPPTPRTHGLDSGKSTCRLPAPAPSLAPVPPGAASTVTPLAAAAFSASSICFREAATQLSSGLPQAIDSADRVGV